ncbi:MAG: OmpA family protein [Prevotellaceae bacterium]|nr:OmpA family protein [Prevotella sp.]MDD7256965.1 OmpA family protein [Prevotellaceae bacterium]MDY6131404.1 OmpA family protein [Prevotella sp.]
MKKLFVLLVFATVSVSSMAQTEDVPAVKHSVATNSFWSNWFIQGGLQGTTWYSNQEHGWGLTSKSNSPFASERTNLGLSLAVGKWFTPGLGLRTKWQGIWAKSVNPDTENKNIVGKSNEYWTLSEQALFNLSNMLCGYNPDRVWNVIPFIGGGIARSMTYDFYTMNIGVGLLNQFKLSNRVALNVELGWNRYEEDIDGSADMLWHNVGYGRGWVDKDNQLYAEVGLTVNLGKTLGWNRVPDVDAIKQLSQSQIDALNAQLGDANSEIDRLKTELAQKPKTETKEVVVTKSVKDFITTPVSVFFNLGKTEIAVLKDLVNVQALAKYAIENNSNILVTGYADSATGTPAINKVLSEKRAQRVANELIKMGVNAERIKTASYGGVAILEPVDFNRRATVQITED